MMARSADEIRECGPETVSGAAAVGGEACNVRAITTLASMAEVAAQFALGEPLERPGHFRTPHSTHPCAPAHRCCVVPADAATRDGHL